MIHRFLSLWLVWSFALLYGFVSFPASAENPPEQEAPAASETPPPLIALILPTQSKSLAAPARALQQGIEAAIEKEKSLVRLKLYETTEAEGSVLKQYERAVQDGAVFVLGPLARNHVNALSNQATIAVPTLTFSSFDAQTVSNPRLFSVNLSIESEAKQLARSMHGRGIRSPLVVVAEPPLMQRIHSAFAEEWLLLTGKAPESWAFKPKKIETVAWATLLEKKHTDAVFLATDLQSAKKLTPNLITHVPVYGTSQLSLGRKTVPELAGVWIMEIPWMLKPTQRLVSNPKKALSVDLERFYALGADAWYLTLKMLANPDNSDAWSLDKGQTGQLKIDTDHQFSRGLLLFKMTPQAKH